MTDLFLMVTETVDEKTRRLIEKVGKLNDTVERLLSMRCPPPDEVRSVIINLEEAGLHHTARKLRRLMEEVSNH